MLKFILTGAAVGTVALLSGAGSLIGSGFSNFNRVVEDRTNEDKHLQDIP